MKLFSKFPFPKDSNPESRRLAKSLIREGYRLTTPITSECGSISDIYYRDFYPDSEVPLQQADKTKSLGRMCYWMLPAPYFFLNLSSVDHLRDYEHILRVVQLDRFLRSLGLPSELHTYRSNIHSALENNLAPKENCHFALEHIR